jgi:methylglutaconyl-CoA hydratase
LTLGRHAAYSRQLDQPNAARGRTGRRPTSEEAPLPTDPREQGQVTQSVTNGVATIEFGHPKSNSLPGPLLARLAETISAVAGDPATRVIVLQSEGTGPFCAGASFDELRAVTDPESGRRFFSGFARVILAMVRAPQFVVARVQGKAAGGGVGLVAASDYAIATRAASVKLSELAVGIGPFVVGPAIEWKIGRGPYAAMAVDAEWRTADWAYQRGLYAELCDQAEALDQAVVSRARWLSERNGAAIRELKRVFWAGTGHWEELLLERAGTSGSLVLTPAAQREIARASRRE